MMDGFNLNKYDLNGLKKVKDKLSVKGLYYNDKLEILSDVLCEEWYLYKDLKFIKEVLNMFYKSCSKQNDNFFDQSDDYLDNAVCPSCGDKNMEKWGIVVYECLNCGNMIDKDILEDLNSF